jgi:hypothetical protein
MTITTHWYNEAQSIVLTEFDGKWSWDDFHDAVHEAHELIASVPHTVDLVMFHKVDPPVGNPMMHFHRAMEDQPNNIGQVIIVNPKISPAGKKFMSILANVLGKWFPSKRQVLIVDSLDDATTLVIQGQMAVT